MAEVADSYLRELKGMLKLADIRIDGKRPEDIIIHNPDTGRRAFAKGSLGVGESYMDGWWDSRKLDVAMTKLFLTGLESKVNTKNVLGLAVKARLFNMQAGSKSYKNARAHYDIGNDLYEPMLGKTMAYSCAYWAWGAKTLDEAQRDKYDLIAKKLGIKKGMKVLDVGCGWGGLGMHLAKKYGANVVGITPAKEQVAFIKNNAKGLKFKVEMTTWQDYKTTTKFDRIVSVGAMEHFGPKNYRALYEKLSGLIKDDGLFLMHTIGGNLTGNMDPWMNKYIFPGAVLPSMKQMTTASEGLFVMEDWHNMGANYDKTLMCWYKNFHAAYPKLDHDKYNERFVRMWDFYLLTCAAQFRARSIQLWQVVYSKKGVPGGYKSVR